MRAIEKLKRLDWDKYLFVLGMTLVGLFLTGIFWGALAGCGKKIEDDPQPRAWQEGYSTCYQYPNEFLIRCYDHLYQVWTVR